MKNRCYEAFEAFIGQKIINSRTVSGGDVAQASLIETSGGLRFFLKTSPQAGLFDKEVQGIRELRRAGVFRLAEVVYTDAHCMVLEWIDTGTKDPDFFERFGQLLAQLHRTTAPEYGYSDDNFLGRTPQPNRAEGIEKTHWPSFYWHKRLRWQLALAEDNGLVSDTLVRHMAHIEDRIEAILAAPAEAPSLLHGDLWAGNYIVSRQQEPVLIDPAVYYGHREAELAMTRLFGGFRAEFYQAYERTWPLAPGADYRMPIYQLYHVLNHLNLFGKSYLPQAENLAGFYR